MPALKDDIAALRAAGLLPLNGDFFPSVHYPPITMYPPISEQELFKGYEAPASGLFDIYVHIPFCQRQCVFCHYPVLLDSPSSEKDRYLDALEAEMNLYLRKFGLLKFKARSILIGGGTPTFLTPAQLERFLRSFTSKLDMSALTQFNYDLDPGSLLGHEGQRKIDLLKAYGVTRLTLGLQSLDAAILKKMNRPHDAAQAVQGVRSSLDAGFVTNIEFIYGYPGETLESWLASVTRAISLGADEIQLYRLKVEPYGDRAGPIANLRGGRGEVLDLERIFAMKTAAIALLAENGYTENLRRVYSKKREIYSHYADNQCCGLLDQIGFGQTAFSSLRDRFALNTMSVPEYQASVAAGRLPVDRGKVRDREDQRRWAVVLPLKNRKVWKSYFKKITGESLDAVFREKIARLKQFGLLAEDEKSIALTELGGLFADEVCQQFHRPEHIPFPREAYAPGPLNPHLDCVPQT